MTTQLNGTAFHNANAATFGSAFETRMQRYGLASTNLLARRNGRRNRRVNRAI